MSAGFRDQETTPAPNGCSPGDAAAQKRPVLPPSALTCHQSPSPRVLGQGTHPCAPTERDLSAGAITAVGSAGLAEDMGCGKLNMRNELKAAAGRRNGVGGKGAE